MFYLMFVNEQDVWICTPQWIHANYRMAHVALVATAGTTDLVPSNSCQITANHLKIVVT